MVCSQPITKPDPRWARRSCPGQTNWPAMPGNGPIISRRRNAALYVTGLNRGDISTGMEKTSIGQALSSGRTGKENRRISRRHTWYRTGQPKGSTIRTRQIHAGTGSHAVTTRRLSGSRLSKWGALGRYALTRARSGCADIIRQETVSGKNHINKMKKIFPGGGPLSILG